MENFIYLIAFVCAVLNIALFFKVWRMTDDVHAIRRRLAPRKEEIGKFDSVPSTWEEADKNASNLQVDKDNNLQIIDN